MTVQTPQSQSAPQSGYAPVNGLRMYYEIHGSGGTPLLLLHGGLFSDVIGLLEHLDVPQAGPRRRVDLPGCPVASDLSRAPDPEASVHQSLAAASLFGGEWVA